MAKKDAFKVGDKVKFKKNVDLFPSPFTKVPIKFAKKGDKGVVVKSDVKVVRKHSGADRIVAVKVGKHKTPVYLMDHIRTKALYINSTIEKL